MPTFVFPGDLAPFAAIDAEKAEQMIVDAEALAIMVAPFIIDPEFAHRDAVRGLLRSAILRRNDAGTGVRKSRTMGPFGEVLDTTTGHSADILTAAEIGRLQGLRPGGPPKRRVVQAWAVL